MLNIKYLIISGFLRQKQIAINMMYFTKNYHMLPNSETIFSGNAGHGGGQLSIAEKILRANINFHLKFSSN